jgi:hypothetical protein
MYSNFVNHISHCASVPRTRLYGSRTRLTWEYLSPKHLLQQCSGHTSTGKCHLSGRWMVLGKARVRMERWITQTVWMLSHRLEWSAHYYRHAFRPTAC